MGDCFFRHKKADTHIFFIGHGGSSAIASHMTADFMKNGGIKTYSLYDNAVTTCMGNDYGYEYVFSRPLEFLGQENDLLVAVSSSGNSQNIVNVINAEMLRIWKQSPLQVLRKIINQNSWGQSMYMYHRRSMGLWNLFTI